MEDRVFHKIVAKSWIIDFIFFKKSHLGDEKHPIINLIKCLRREFMAQQRIPRDASGTPEQEHNRQVLK